MRELIPKFPRIVSFPIKILAKNENDFYYIVNKYNGIKSKIYFGVYDCDIFRNYDKCYMHVIFFDLDSEKSLDNVMRLFDYCERLNLRCCSIFSTGGFWFYIKTKNGDKIKNKKACLKNAQLDVIEKVGLSVGKDAKKDDVDYHIIGDIKRVARMIGTYDLGRGLFAISVNKEQLSKGINHIKIFAKKYNNKIYWYGEEGLDLSKYDYIPIVNRPEFKEYKYDVNVTDKFLAKLLPCVRYNMINTSLKGHNRFWVWITIYLKDRFGLGSKQIVKIVKPYLEKWKRDDGLGDNDFIHYCINDNLPDSVFNDGYLFPSCDKLYENGFCKGKCEHYNEDVIYVNK